MLKIIGHDLCTFPISAMVNGTLLNFGKRYEDNVRVIFDQWPKLHLGLDVLSNKKILKGVYYICIPFPYEYGPRAVMGVNF